MGLFFDQAIKFFGSVTSYFKKPMLSEISNKRLLTEAELALYFGRKSNWTSDLRKKGVLMEKKHYFDFHGLILYSIEDIVNDIMSGTLT